MRRRGCLGKVLAVLLALLLLCGIGAIFSDHEPDLLEGQESTVRIPEPDENEDRPDGTGGKPPHADPEPAGQEETDPSGADEAELPEDSFFEVHFLDVGQADAALVLCDGRAMMIDGGYASSSRMIYTYLEERGIDHLDCVVCSHPHDDHVGGLAAALNAASADTAMCPVTEYDTRAFESFAKYLDGQGVAITVPSPGDTFCLGSAEVRILGPYGPSADLNDMSIVLKIEYGATSFLFTGDAEREEEQDLLNAGADLKSSVLKVGHHGGASSTTYPFLREVMPEYAVISVGEDNAYGHPTEEVLSRLRDAGAELYRTDLQGTVVCVSDGTAVTFRTEKTAESDVYERQKKTVVPVVPSDPVPEESSGETEGAPGRQTDADGEPPAQAREYTYILNTNTYKFHWPSCPSVSQMNDANKQVYVGTREEILDMGYVPCERCEP